MIDPAAFVHPLASVGGEVTLGVGHRAVVREGMAVDPGVLVAGVPARVVRARTDGERARLVHTAAASMRLQARHAGGAFPPLGRPPSV